MLAMLILRTWRYHSKEQQLSLSDYSFPLVHVQPHPQALKVATVMKIDSELQGSWGMLLTQNLSKSSFRGGTDNNSV